MAAQTVTVEGIDYFTLFETPSPEGGADAPCVLLTHALMSNLHMYDDTVPVLHAAGYSTLRFDHVGHGRTPTPSAHADAAARRQSLGGPLAFHIDDIARHMRALAVARTGAARLAAVVGCSIGGVLALRYALLFGGAEVAAVLSLAAPGISTPSAAGPLWSARIRQFEADRAGGDDSLCRATVERWLPGAGPQDVRARERALGQVRTCSLEGYVLLADAIRNYDYAGHMAQLSGVRCLIVAGSEDSAVQSETLRELAAEIDGARFECMQGAGHLPPLHRPAEFNALMLDFLGKA